MRLLTDKNRLLWVDCRQVRHVVIKLFIAVLLMFLASRTKTESFMNATQLQAFAQKYTAAWCSQNPANVAAFFSESGLLKINEGAPSVGRAAITAAARGFMTAFPDMVVSMVEVTGNGKLAAYRWRLTGTNTGPGGTGMAVHISGYEEWTIGPEGLIAKSLGHFDEADYQRQLATGVHGG